MVIKEDLNNILNTLKKREVNFEDQNILITGGSGFLGSYLCDILTMQHANVTCIDNLSSGRLENIQHLLDNYDNFKFIKHDISEPIEISEKLDYIFHFASRANPLDYSKYPVQTLKANSIGTWVVLNIAKKHRSRLLYASTSEIYGDPDSKNVPTPESYFGYVNPVGPRSCYDESKRFGETIAFIYNLEYNIDSRIARIFNTYGPRMRFGDVAGRAIPRFITQALLNLPITIFGNGLQTRSFTYVSDEIIGLLLYAHMDGLEGEVLNIGNQKERTIKEVIALIKQKTKSDSQIEYHPLPRNDPMRRAADISKAKRLIDWEPKITLEEGIERTISWYKELINSNETEFEKLNNFKKNNSFEFQTKLLQKLL